MVIQCRIISTTVWVRPSPTFTRNILFYFLPRRRPITVITFIWSHLEPSELLGFGLICPSSGILKKKLENTMFRKPDLFPPLNEEGEALALLCPLERVTGQCGRIDEVHKLSNSERYTSSAEPIRIYSYGVWCNAEYCHVYGLRD
jgi:hypothetical protein